MTYFLKVAFMIYYLLENYIQTGNGSLFVKSSRTFSVSGFHHPYTWNETIDYDESNDRMPTMAQTLHANSVSASYRCMTGVRGKYVALKRFIKDLL